MATPRIFLIHALRESIGPANAAMAAGWPEATVANLLDDSLSADLAAQRGRLDDAIVRRFLDLGTYAHNSGANGILFTCSAFGPAIEAVRAALPVPVLKPNEAALEAALERGPRIALLATFAATIPSMTHELEIMARERGIVPTIMTRVVDGALADLQRGDAAAHDKRIVAAARDHSVADALVLAQFSMARAAAAIGPGNARVITTPDSAVAKLRSLVRTRAHTRT
ncbi:MAG: aspartate/glutamate racemase family protein [Alphaproteobacteria bacterium]|nr:aspartate/glutamate racemase family protein [Alphaproteobacteria bacterium]